MPKAKAGQRAQPITPELAAILRRERGMRDDPDGWIFPSPRPTTSGTGHRDRMDKPFRNAVVAAGLDPAVVTPHIMRHTAITKLVKAGVDLPTVQRISGHKTLTMVLRYTHVHGDHIDRAMKALGRALPEPTANETPGTVTQELHTGTEGASGTASAEGQKVVKFQRERVVPRGGIEPPTRGFSVRCS
ncbi:MAG: tyrosine-type recombinase/integrase, partial [Alphaproteobacteria bacterium]